MEEKERKTATFPKKKPAGVREARAQHHMHPDAEKAEDGRKGAQSRALVHAGNAVQEEEKRRKRTEV